MIQSKPGFQALGVRGAAPRENFMVKHCFLGKICMPYDLPEAASGTRQLRFAIAELLVGSGCMAAMHCNREEVVSIAIPDRRFSDTLAVYLLPRLVLTRTLRLLENRLLAGNNLKASSPPEQNLGPHPLVCLAEVSPAQRRKILSSPSRGSIQGKGCSK